VGQDPGEQKSKQGYPRQRDWQQQAEVATGNLLCRFNGPKG
jgi:hypothetical protein